MNRYGFEKFLGKRITVILFDDGVITGTLHRTGEKEFECNPNLYLYKPGKAYFLVDPDNAPTEAVNNSVFLLYHVDKVKCDEEEKDCCRACWFSDAGHTDEKGRKIRCMKLHGYVLPEGICPLYNTDGKEAKP